MEYTINRMEVKPPAESITVTLTPVRLQYLINCMKSTESFDDEPTNWSDWVEAHPASTLATFLKIQKEL